LSAFIDSFRFGVVLKNLFTNPVKTNKPELFRHNGEAFSFTEL